MPIVSLVDYHASTLKRFWLFIVSEFLEFVCAAGKIYYEGQEEKLW
ncbi:MAG TPA: hypothetical protein VE445_09310 [Nitrososphaeraceae archaeon]|nr:hypothetical protein [Nitrososphaeraceae archaeon]